MRNLAARIANLRPTTIRYHGIRLSRYPRPKVMNKMDDRQHSTSSFVLGDAGSESGLDHISNITNVNGTILTSSVASAATLYPSLLLPWSYNPSEIELRYRNSNHVKTKGTIFLLPPPIPTLVSTFNSPPRPRTRMSAGAVALCKHFERGVWNRYNSRDSSTTATNSIDSSPVSHASQLLSKPSAEHQILHSFWPLPTGSNENKTRVAAGVLEHMLRDAIWKNVMLLHVGVAVYEIRNSRGYGMRWTLEVEKLNGQNGDNDGGLSKNALIDEEKTNKGETKENETSKKDVEGKNWSIKKVSFRGFLEPIEGLDHELPTLEDGEIWNQVVKDGFT